MGHMELNREKQVTFYLVYCSECTYRPDVRRLLKGCMNGE